jgi:hypothetical protein
MATSSKVMVRTVEDGFFVKVEYNPKTESFGFSGSIWGAMDMDGAFGLIRDAILKIGQICGEPQEGGHGEGE